MTDRKPPRDPQTPPPLPPRLDTVRPGYDRPEDRPRTAGRPAVRTGPPRRPPPSPDRPPIGHHSRSAPTRTRRGWPTYLAVGLLGVLGILAAGAAYLVVAPPVDLIRQQLIAQVKAKTGRTLTIAGPATFTLYPSLTLVMRDVTLSAPPAMGGAPFATMAELDASLKPFDLLQRRISISKLTLREPVIDLRVDAAGRRSWDFASGDIIEPRRFAQAKPLGNTKSDLPDAVQDFVQNASDPDNPSPQMKAKLARIEDLVIEDVRIDRGTVFYADARTNRREQVSGIDARLGLKSLASPLDATGSLVYLGQTVGFDAKLASPKAVLEERPAKLALAIKAAPVDARFDGVVTARTGIDLDGDISGKTVSVRALARWLRTELPAADGFGPASIAGKLKVTGATYAFNEATIALDGATATGAVLIEGSGVRPRVNAALKVSEIDLNRYSLEAAAAVAAPIAPTQGKPVLKGTGGAPESSARSIEDLINAGAGGPQVKGYAKRAGWGEERIPLDALASLECECKMTVGKLRFRDVKVGPASVVVSLKSGVLRLTFDDVQLYDGRGRGFIQVDASGITPVVGANLTVDGVTALALLKDAGDIDVISGTGRLALAVGAQGVSETDLVRTANGKADFRFTNGSIAGYNVVQRLNGAVGRLQVPSLARNPAEKTDFGELAATFAIANGIATTADVRLTGPALRGTGAGQIALPAQTLDFSLKPAINPGPGVNELIAGRELPLRVAGPWSDLKLVDIGGLGGVLKDPSKAADVIKDVGRQLKEGGGKDLGNKLKGLLGKGQGTEGQAAGDGQGQKFNPRQLLDKLLKPNPQQPPPQPPAAPQ